MFQLTLASETLAFYCRRIADQQSRVFRQQRSAQKAKQNYKSEQIKHSDNRQKLPRNNRCYQRSVRNRLHRKPHELHQVNRCKNEPKKQQIEEVFMTFVADAVCNKRAVMIHSTDAPFTHFAMMRVMRLVVHDVPADSVCQSQFQALLAGSRLA